MTLYFVPNALVAEGGDSGNGGGFSYAAASVLFSPLAFCIVVGFALRIPYAAASVLASINKKNALK